MEKINKFENYKKDLLEKNENEFGEEIRKKYGEKEIENSNRKLLNMTEKEYEKIIEIENNFFEEILKGFYKKDINSTESKNAIKYHREWLNFFGEFYTDDIHKEIVNMYLYDERFKKYYEKETGLTEFFVKAVEEYYKK